MTPDRSVAGSAIGRRVYLTRSGLADSRKRGCEAGVSEEGVADPQRTVAGGAELGEFALDVDVDGAEEVDVRPAPARCGPGPRHRHVVPRRASSPAPARSTRSSRPPRRWWPSSTAGGATTPAPTSAEGRRRDGGRAAVASRTYPCRNHHHCDGRRPPLPRPRRNNGTLAACQNDHQANPQFQRPPTQKSLSMSRLHFVKHVPRPHTSAVEVATVDEVGEAVLLLGDTQFTEFGVDGIHREPVAGDVCPDVGGGPVTDRESGVRG